jgi:hypothetical protein
MRREYQGAAQAARLTVALGGTVGDLVIYCDDLSNWPTGISSRPFYVVIDRNTSAEEKILCSSRSGNTLTVYNVGGSNGRGADDTSITAHSSNSVIEHVFTATDADEANSHVNDSTSDVHPQYVLESTINAKGDILIGTANDTVSRQAVGTDGQVLAADSTTSTGLDYIDLPAQVAYALAAAEGTWNVGASLTSIVQGASMGALVVTFPVGRFSQAPVVVTQTVELPAVARSAYAAFSVYSSTTSSVTLNVINAGPPSTVSGGGTITQAKVHITAIQMTSGSAIG